MTYGIFIGIASTIGAVLLFWQYWTAAQGQMRRMYILFIFVNSLMLLQNSVMIIKNHDQVGLLPFHAVFIWGVSMGIKGLLRLRKEKENDTHT